MTTVLCTLYNSLYLDKGLVLYESLCECAKDFKLYVLCMDDKCYEVLADLRQEHTIPIRLSDFENGDEKLLKAKENRSFGEYCWTCTPSIILYVLEKFKEPVCTYIDADMYFYHDPQILIDEMLNSGKSVMIVPHRFSEANKALEVNGIYCVEFNTFVNNAESLEVLTQWRNDCLTCCSSENDGVHYGDQKYLDTWPQKYGNVYVCENLGAGVAPWNIQSYLLESYTDNSYLLKTRNDKKHFSIVFYHYQGIQYIDDNKVKINVYKAQFNIDRLLLLKLYRPYLRKCNHFKKCLSERYGINTVIRSHPAFKKMTRRPLMTILSELSFSNILYRFMLRYNRKKDIICY